MTPTVPTDRLSTAPDQRHYHHRDGPGLGWTRPFALTSMILLRAMPRHLFRTHPGTHVNSKLLAHLATNNNIECGHMASWTWTGGFVCQTRAPCALSTVNIRLYPLQICITLLYKWERNCAQNRPSWHCGGGKNLFPVAARTL